MEQSYFQIQLDRGIKEAEKLLKQLNAVKKDYADNRMEDALGKSVSAARIAESVTLKTRALPAYTGYPQVEMMVQKAIQEVVSIEIGFTEEGWFCLRMPILLPRKEKCSRSYLRGYLYPALERFTYGKPKIRYRNCVLIFRHVYDRNRPEREWVKVSSRSSSISSRFSTLFVNLNILSGRRRSCLEQTTWWRLICSGK